MPALFSMIKYVKIYPRLKRTKPINLNAIASRVSIYPFNLSMYELRTTLLTSISMVLSDDS